MGNCFFPERLEERIDHDKYDDISYTSPLRRMKKIDQPEFPIKENEENPAPEELASEEPDIQPGPSQSVTEIERSSTPENDTKNLKKQSRRRRNLVETIPHYEYIRQCMKAKEAADQLKMKDAGRQEVVDIPDLRQSQYNN